VEWLAIACGVHARWSMLLLLSLSLTCRTRRGRVWSLSRLTFFFLPLRSCGPNWSSPDEIGFSAYMLTLGFLAPVSLIVPANAAVVAAMREVIQGNFSSTVWRGSDRCPCWSSPSLLQRNLIPPFVVEHGQQERLQSEEHRRETRESGCQVSRAGRSENGGKMHLLLAGLSY